MTPTPQHPRYQFDQWIAGGGMGEVWRATDTLLDREVAVKVLRRELAEDPVLRARFAAEARHAGSLQHPNVASVLDFGELDVGGPSPLPFLVMELVEGQPLSALLSGGQPLDDDLAADLIAQAADGLQAAHALGIIHRDVKPGNLLVTADRQVKVTDFGVARAADTASLTTTGHLVGTPNYLSPEQAEGKAATTISDVYSLGIVLYECLTGRKPFSGETPVATAVMQIREPLPGFPSSVPERLQRITRIATAKDPGARFRSAGAMAGALRDESPDTRGFLIPDAAELEVAATGRAHRDLVNLRRVLVGAVALLLVSGGVWAMTGSAEDPLGSPAEASSPDVSDVGPELVRVRAAAFRGLDVDEATRRLRQLGLRHRTERQENPGTKRADTVAAVAPTGWLEPGTRVLLTVWSAPPAQGTPDEGSGDLPAPGGGQSDVGGDPTKPGGTPTGTGGSNAGGNGKGQSKGQSKGNNGAKPGKGGKR